MGVKFSTENKNPQVHPFEFIAHDDPKIKRIFLTSEKSSLLVSNELSQHLKNKANV